MHWRDACRKEINKLIDENDRILRSKLYMSASCNLHGCTKYPMHAVITAVPLGMRGAHVE